MAGKYISKFSGKELDDAIQYTLQLSKKYKLFVVDSSQVTDLNTIKDEGRYVIERFINSSDDTESPKYIELLVTTIGDGTIIQSYTSRGKSVERKYNGTKWLSWEEKIFDSNVIRTITKDEEITNISSPTMVFRKMSESSKSDEVFTS